MTAASAGMIGTVGYAEGLGCLACISFGCCYGVALREAHASRAEILLLDEPTLHLDDAAVEWLRAWLKERTSRRNVEGFFMCTAPNCRNVRAGFNKRPFDPVIRIPLPE